MRVLLGVLCALSLLGWAFWPLIVGLLYESPTQSPVQELILPPELHMPPVPSHFYMIDLFKKVGTAIDLILNMAVLLSLFGVLRIRAWIFRSLALLNVLGCLLTVAVLGSGAVLFAALGAIEAFLSVVAFGAPTVIFNLTKAVVLELVLRQERRRLAQI